MLGKSNLRKLIYYQALVLSMAFFETISIVALGFFMSLISDISLISSSNYYYHAQEFFGFKDELQFLFFLSIAILFVIIFAGIFSIFTTWRMFHFGSHLGADLSNKLFTHYLYRDYIFHSKNNSSTLITNIANETQRISYSIIQQFMVLNSRVGLVLVIFLSILIYNPIVASAGTLVIGLSYLTVYKLINARLGVYGTKISTLQQKRILLMNEGFGGIKDILLGSKQDDFIQRFSKASFGYYSAWAASQTFSMAPRYLLEILAFGSILFLVLFLIGYESNNISTILPTLSIFALAGFKLLPAFQQIFFSVATIRSNISAFNSVRKDLLLFNQYQDTYENEYIDQEGIDFKNINIKNVNYTYPNTNKTIIKGIDLSIPVNKVIGVVGSSGSGKSTLIDMILGLLKPETGSICIDEMDINKNKKNLSQWQRNIGFVPQEIFLSDATIRENIAFGIEPSKIDETKIDLSIQMAHLVNFIDNLSAGKDTMVGERGVQLSGGQRQRIGIARALYSNPSVLILDEATSSLDGISEKAIMETIHDFSGKKTLIIIAHRLATVKRCDIIYLLEEGKIKSKGAFNQLSLEDDLFKSMTENQ